MTDTVATPPPNGVSAPHTVELSSTAAGLKKQLSWFDGFSMAMLVPNGIIIFIGAAISSIGALAAIAFVGFACVIALFQNYLYYEMAMMFPGETGGIAMFANRAWSRYFTPIGPLAAFGYWLGWALTGAVVGESLGSFVEAEWFSSQTWALHTGLFTFTFPQAVAVVVILASFAVNARGVKFAARIYRVIAIAYGIFAVAVMFVPFLHAHWNSSRLLWHPGHHVVITALVWMYVSAWTVYSTEICATFAPEYRKPKVDTGKALRAAGMFTLGVFWICPISTTGQLGEHVITNNPQTFSVMALQNVLGHWITQIVILIIVGELLLAVFASSGDAGRTLLGMSRRGLTVRQLAVLNRHNEPGRALAVDAVINCLVVVLVSSPLAALFASNLGYMIATIAAVSGFLLLRKDQSDADRPLKLGKPWLPIAAVILILDLAMTWVGVTHPSASGYGSGKDVVIGVAILAVSLVFWVIRQVWQDKRKLVLRERLDAEVTIVEA